jgi:hypothetical protein
MFTTTVVHPYSNEIEKLEKFNQEKITALHEFRSGLLTPEEAETQQVEYDHSNNQKTIVRHWPSQEIAQQYVDYIISNFDVTSAVVNA